MRRLLGWTIIFTLTAAGITAVVVTAGLGIALLAFGGAFGSMALGALLAWCFS